MGEGEGRRRQGDLDGSQGQSSGRERKEPAPPPIYKQQAKFLKAARKAAQAGDAAGIKSNLLSWGRLEWPDDAPRSVGEMANRVSIPLSTQLQALCSASYGPGDETWNGEELAKSLRSITVLRDDTPEQQTDGLPPLSPA